MAGSKKPGKASSVQPEAPSSRELSTFYKTPNGQLLDSEIAKCLGDSLKEKKLPKRYLLCIGYPTPSCVPLFRQAKSFSILTPFFQGPKKLVEKGLNRTALGDEAHLPFIEASFDIAVISHSVEYMEDPVSFFEELWKVLSPGGRIFLIIPNRTGGWQKAGIPHSSSEQGFNYKAANEFLLEKGFACVDCKGVFHGLKFAKGKRPILEGVMKSVVKKGPGIMPGFLVIEAEKIIGAREQKKEQSGQLAPTTPVPT